MSNLTPLALEITNLLRHGGPEAVARWVLAREPQWQPIETAPRYGGILCSDGKDVWSAWHYDEGNWADRCGSRGATHWMPLPEAPTNV
jgi:hypothetical protein